MAATSATQAIPTEPCPACGSELRAAHDWVSICPACKLEKSSLEPGYGRDIEGLEDLRRRNFRRILSRLSQQKDLSGCALLEVGCAEGWFIEAAMVHGANAVGVEPSPGKADLNPFLARQLIKGRFPEATRSLDAGCFDLVIFNDVFEHLSHPDAVLKECHRLLSPGGLLVINLPLNSGFFYRCAKLLGRTGWHGPYERLWQKGQASPHLYYHSRRSISRLVESGGHFLPTDQFRLDSLTITGLWTRIRPSFESPLIAALVYLGSAATTLCQGFLPADIGVFVFRKPSEKDW